MQGGLEHPKITVYYETKKRELKKRLMYECRCDERLDKVNRQELFICSRIKKGEDRGSRMTRELVTRLFVAE